MSYVPNSQKNVQTSVPSTGNTIAITLGVEAYVAVPAGTLANFGFTLPATPPDGTIFRGVSTQAITAFTLTSQGADSLVGVPSALVANAGFSFIYVKANTTWYRIS